MNTKRLARKTITGGVAAALLLGGFAYAPQAKPAYAAEVQQTAASSSIVANYLRNLVTYTSWVADRDVDDVQSDLFSGKTLATASGLSSAELKDRLVSNFNWFIDNNAATGLSSEDLQKVREEGARQISEAITQPGYQPDENQASVNLKAVIQQRLNALASDVALITNDDIENIDSKLESGSTLAIASGLPQALLIDSLRDLMYASIDNAVGQLPVDSDKVQQAKTDALRQIRTAITTPGGYHVSAQTNEFSLDDVINNRIAYIISDAATIADKNYSDVIQDLQSGCTLAQAVGMSQSDLSIKLNELIDKEIDTAADQNAIDPELVTKAKNDAGSKISDILSQAGYSSSNSNSSESVNDLNAQVDARLKVIVSDAATIADKENYEIQDMVDQGASLATATGISGMELFERLMAPVNQYIESLSSDADAVAAAKAKAADQVRTWVEAGYNN
ncbi:hypothetical protein [Paenibacillus sp. UNC451MF]|uniref:hypothetical protein n=1 Tax=Paenibacillus sp. UNC451MF TaxID=1449063 RepID=UPI00048C950D|nr:hypothetical protein [Paenibacillus sp. UNC451MF]